MIYVYNLKNETHDNEKNNIYIGRPSIFGNPYTHIKDKQTLAMYLCKDKDESIDRYDHYFDLMYGGNKEFQKAVDQLYELYRNGEDIYLACYCAPNRCHGDIIKEKLQKRLIKERIEKTRKPVSV